MDSNDLLDVVKNLDLLSTDYKKLAKDIMKDDTQVMKIDLVALSILNRAISINNAFKTLIAENNTYAALHLIRIQLDNLIRYNSIFLTDDEKYLDYILSGEPIINYRDGNANKFSDGYLARKLNEKSTGMLDLYNKYCGHIHFGKEHLERIKSTIGKENVQFRIEIGNFDDYSFEERKSFVLDMIKISFNLYIIIKEWVNFK